MSKQYVQTIGFGGPTPLAIIFWKQSEEEGAFCKTVCYNEDDVMAMYKRHTTEGDFYNKLVPSVHLVDGTEPVQKVA